MCDWRVLRHASVISEARSVFQHRPFCKAFRASLDSLSCSHLIIAISKAISLDYSGAFSNKKAIAISKAMSKRKSRTMPLSTDEIDGLDIAILDYFLEGRETGDPWGKATPSEIYRALDERGTLDQLDNPVRQTVQHRIQRLALASHLKNKYDSGSYEFVSDPRDSQSRE